MKLEINTENSMKHKIDTETQWDLKETPKKWMNYEIDTENSMKHKKSKPTWNRQRKFNEVWNPMKHEIDAEWCHY